MQRFTDPDLLIPDTISPEMIWDDYVSAYHALELQQPSSQIITITGTNGKSSIAHILADKARQDGYQVACFSSPHLINFRERLQINQSWPGDHQWNTAAQEICVRLKDYHLTLFAWITLVALKIISQQPFDLIILEVGVGGRIDPTNIWDANLAILSNLSVDHTNMLGESKGQIAMEKFGILRPGQTVVLGSPDWKPYLTDDLKKDITIYEYSHDCYQEQNLYQFESHEFLVKDFHLRGYWPKNMGCALLAYTLLFEQRSKMVYTPQLALAGRIHWATDRICLDVAHNLQAVQSFVAYLLEQSQAKQLAVCLYFSCARRKDFNGMITWLKSQPIELVVSDHLDSDSITDNDAKHLNITWKNNSIVLKDLTSDYPQAKLIGVCGSFKYIGQIIQKI